MEKKNKTKKTLRLLSKRAEEKVHDLLHTFQNVEKHTSVGERSADEVTNAQRLTTSDETTHNKK